jgi:hypothetical protein
MPDCETFPGLNIDSRMCRPRGKRFLSSQARWGFVRDYDFSNTTADLPNPRRRAGNVDLIRSALQANNVPSLWNASGS